MRIVRKPEKKKKKKSVRLKQRKDVSVSSAFFLSLLFFLAGEVRRGLLYVHMCSCGTQFRGISSCRLERRERHYRGSHHCYVDTHTHIHTQPNNSGLRGKLRHHRQVKGRRSSFLFLFHFLVVFVSPFFFVFCCFFLDYK